MPVPRSCRDGWAPSNIEQVFDNHPVGSTASPQQPTREQVVADLRRRMGTAGPVTAPVSKPVDAVVPLGPLSSPGGVLPVVEPLAALLPRAGLPRGGVVSVIGDGSAGARAGGASSLLLSLLAGPERRWSAVVGLPDIGLLAASELGVDLDHLVVVPDPGPDVLQVLSVLADGVDLIVVGTDGGVIGTPARIRVLTGRLRQHGTVLLVAGRWPGADLVLTARHTGWVGLGRGHGRLRDRELTIGVGGRRAGAFRKEGTILLSGRRDGAVVASTQPAPSATRRSTVDPGIPIPAAG
jgi:hypothetical protein